MTSSVIAAYKTRTKVLDFRAQLYRAETDNYAEVYGGHSSIGVVLCDYTNKNSGGQSITVKASLGVEQVLALYEQVKAAIQNASNGMSIDSASGTVLRDACDELSAVCNFVASPNGQQLSPTQSQWVNEHLSSGVQKICKVRDSISPAGGIPVDYSQVRVHAHKEGPDGKAPVQELYITRRGVRQDGSIAKYPWTVRIVNAVAPVNRKPDGTVTYSTNGYEKRGDVFTQVSDGEMFRLLTACKRFIGLWENAFGLNLITVGEKQRREEIEAAINAAQAQSQPTTVQPQPQTQTQQ